MKFTVEVTPFPYNPERVEFAVVQPATITHSAPSVPIAWYATSPGASLVAAYKPEEIQATSWPRNIPMPGQTPTASKLPIKPPRNLSVTGHTVRHKQHPNDKPGSGHMLAGVRSQKISNSLQCIFTHRISVELLQGIRFFRKDCNPYFTGSEFKSLP